MFCAIYVFVTFCPSYPIHRCYENVFITCSCMSCCAVFLIECLILRIKWIKVSWHIMTIQWFNHLFKADPSSYIPSPYFLNIDFIFFAPITLADEYHAWFYLYGLRWAVNNDQEAKQSKWKNMPPPGIGPATTRFQAWRPNPSATRTLNGVLLKLLHYSWLSINTCDKVWNWLWFGLFILSSVNSKR